MAVVSVTHKKVVTIPDDPNYPVGSDEWNDNHAVSGLENVDNTSDINKPVSTAQAAAIAAGVAGVTKTSLGLGSVDNTSDANKPVSTAQAAAIAAGVASVTKTSIGLGSVDNTSDVNKPVSTAQAAADAAVAAAAANASNLTSGTVPTARLAFVQAGTGAVTRTVQDKARDFVSIKDFGGVGDGVTDNVAALNAALAALTGTGGAIYFPPGKYKFSAAITYAMPAGIFSVTVLGAGQDNTILYWPNAAAGLTFTYTDFGQSVHVSDLAFTSGQNGTGTALTLTRPTTGFLQTYPMNDIVRVTFRGDDNHGNFTYSNYWAVGALVNGVSGTSWDSVTVLGGPGAGVGLRFTGPSSAGFAINHAIARSAFNSLNIGVQYDSFSQGIMIAQTSFFNDHVGVFVPSGAAAGLSQLMISDSAFQMVQSSADACVSINSQVNGVQIVNNVFLPSDSAPAISLTSTSGFNIAGNSITPGFTVHLGFGIVINSSVANTEGTISGNTIRNMGVGIQLGASSARTNVQGNAFTGNATTLTNSGTANVIANNLGYNPVGSGNISVGASPFTYTAGASPETVYMFNGTVSHVDLTGGIFAAVATNTSFNLGPNESIVVNYTAAPSMSKMVH